MKITLTQISTKDLATLAERAINSSKKGTYKIVHSHKLLQKMEEEYETYKKVYSKLTYSGQGKSVAEADKHRDKIYSGIKGYLSGFVGVPELAGYSEAMALYEVFKKYGLDLDRLSYSAETAQMNNLLLELDAETNKEKIATLQLTAYFAKLKQAQTDFEAIYATQAEANAELSSLPSATTIRRNLEKALRNYFTLLTAMKDDEEWSLLYQDINQIVKGINNTVTTKKKTESTEQE